VRTEPRRGAVEHFYRAVALPFLDDAQWSRLPVAMRRRLTGQTFRRIFVEGSEAGAAGGFDLPGASITRTLLTLDERGWRELSEALVRVLEEAQLIQDRSDARAKGEDGGADGEIRSSELAILHFALSVPAAPTTKAPSRRAGRARAPRRASDLR